MNYMDISDINPGLRSYKVLFQYNIGDSKATASEIIGTQSTEGVSHPAALSCSLSTSKRVLAQHYPKSK